VRCRGGRELGLAGRLFPLTRAGAGATTRVKTSLWCQSPTALADVRSREGLQTGKRQAAAPLEICLGNTHPTPEVRASVFTSYFSAKSCSRPGLYCAALPVERSSYVHPSCLSCFPGTAFQVCCVGFWLRSNWRRIGLAAAFGLCDALASTCQ